MMNFKIRSELNTPQTRQSSFPFCCCGATVLKLDQAVTCAHCGDTLLCEGMPVKVSPTRQDGKPHPHAGKAGRIVRFLSIYSEPYWLGPPSAMIGLDSGIGPQRFIWVSLISLKAQQEAAPAVDVAHTKPIRENSPDKTWMVLIAVSSLVALCLGFLY